MSHPLQSWPVAWGGAVVLHLALAVVPVHYASEAPQEFVDFELASLEPPPPPEPVPEPEPEPVKPPGPKNPDPTADPERTSVKSNREVETPPDKPVPLRTGLALTPDQLTESDMGVRVGNTDEAGYDADVAPGDLQGFVGGGAGGGDGQVVNNPPDQSPELLRSFRPRYPASMRQKNIEGRVLLQVEVLPNGRAGRIKVIHGVHPDLDRVAVEATKRFRWRPARTDGKRVAASVPLSVVFTLQ